MSYEPINFCDGVYWSPDGKKRPADGLSVRMTAHCDNACDFCIAYTDMQNIRPMNIPKMIEQVKATGARSMQILGGEPLLFLDNCLEFVKGVEEQIDYMFFTTSLPYTIITQRDKFDELMQRTNSISISIQSTDSDTNNELLRAKKKFDRIALLEEIVQQYPDKVTVILNLMKGGVDSKEKLWEALDDLYSFGVKNVRINELQKATNWYVNFEEISEIEMKSPYAHGCKTPMNFYPGLKILVKRSCFLVENSLTATVEDVEKLEEKIGNPEKFAWQESNVLYEDGTLEGYWLTANDDNAVSIPTEKGPVLLGMPKLRIES